MNNVFKGIERIDRAVARLEQGVIVLLTVLLVLLVVAQVVMRYLFGAPIFWAEEVAVQWLVFISMLGLSLLTHYKQLVQIDLLSQMLPKGAARYLQYAMSFVFLALLVFLTVLCWHWIWRPEVRLELSATTGLPRWYNYIALPASMTAMCFHQCVAVLCRSSSTETTSC